MKIFSTALKNLSVTFGLASSNRSAAASMSAQADDLATSLSMAALGDAGADPVAQTGAILGRGRETRLRIARPQETVGCGFLDFHLVLFDQPQGSANHFTPVVVTAGFHKSRNELFLPGSQGDAHGETLAELGGKVNFTPRTELRTGAFALPRRSRHSRVGGAQAGRPEKSMLGDADIAFHEAEYQRVRGELQAAHDASPLPEMPGEPVPRALNELLLRTVVIRNGGSVPGNEAGPPNAWPSGIGAGGGTRTHTTF